MNEPFLAAPPPRWFTIPAHRPFVTDLAKGLYDALAPGGPEALSDAIVLTPTRRAARALSEAFVEVAGGRPVLLPQIRALGDLDEGEPPFEPGDLALDLPPAISPWRRRFELARLAADHAPALGRSLDAVQALELADALAAFLDSVQIEEAGDLDRLDGWVESELARHWKISADFLRLATQAWPERLEELGLIDLTARRVALLRLLAERWRDTPPEGVLVAAGSTGTAPATADLLRVIAAAPKGCVVLPGLDQDLADKAWDKVDEQHPQGAMKRLLARAGIDRRAVRSFSAPAPGDARGRWRRRIVNEALRPAEATADWLDQIRQLKSEGAAAGVDPIVAGLDGLCLVRARAEEEAAAVAALALREALETPGRTAALICPDQDLARRISARLARWGVTADSSAGSPLAGQPVGALLGLMTRAVVDPLDPVLMLALLKHPLTRLGLEPEALAARVLVLERYGLRGTRPRNLAVIARRMASPVDSDGVPGRRRKALDDADRLLARLQRILAQAGEAYTGGDATPGEAARALVQAVEALAEGPEDGDLGALWSGPAGEAAASLMAALIDESDGLPETTPTQFAELVETLLDGETVRGGAGAHPRLKILGTLEARMVRADLLVLAGLEEGVWPAPAPTDPFLSRPMRAAAGLPPPERRIGLSAHDFAQAASAGEVLLLTCERRGGAPAVASRWLWRLQTLARGAGVAIPGREDLLAWARALDAPIASPPQHLRAAPRPRPTPPLSARPVELPVTGVERWVRDPYAVYAGRILKFRTLERPGEPVDARIRGTAIHAAFEAFAEAHPDVLPAEAESLFAGLLVEALVEAGAPEGRLPREAALAANVAPWVIEFERRRRPGAKLLIEQQGRHSFKTGRGEFTVTAKADRIEHRGHCADILDFKTGAPPSKKQMESGLSPQLTLTAAILHFGGFQGMGETLPGELVYVAVSGGRTPGREEIRARLDESLNLALAAYEGLRKRVERFEDEATPYVSWAAPQFIDSHGGDFDHLARLWEWHVIGEGEAEGGGE
ncbi:double-strand break repair protein AddB [Phenylobacterium montanum]|uniref:Double-strand break repair protein AddB n=1 Tax=Phenylobacterium montanum TaxID=2823693 RepID=A0A975FWR1_9CAUL|nr:double-strand break repair protein AddB [Caulobacter sp. S6]QUD86262.1 double-strand break repair protein AddB [Caulobacter sp. S6]